MDNAHMCFNLATVIKAVPFTCLQVEDGLEVQSSACGCVDGAGVACQDWVRSSAPWSQDTETIIVPSSLLVRSKFGKSRSRQILEDSTA